MINPTSASTGTDSSDWSSPETDAEGGAPETGPIGGTGAATNATSSVPGNDAHRGRANPDSAQGEGEGEGELGQNVLAVVGADGRVRLVDAFTLGSNANGQGGGKPSGYGSFPAPGVSLPAREGTPATSPPAGFRATESHTGSLPTPATPQTGSFPTPAMPQMGPFPTPAMLPVGPFPAPATPQMGPFPTPATPQTGPFPAPAVPQMGPFPTPATSRTSLPVSRTPPTGPLLSPGGALPSAPGQPAPPPTLSQGKTHVARLEADGELTPERASQILADPKLLSQIGQMAGDGTDPEGTRAVEVLIGDVGTSAGVADRHLSNLAQTGGLGPEQFRALANDGEFSGALSELLSPGPDGAPPNAAAADRLVDQAVGNLASDRPTMQSDGQEAFVSRDGLLFRAPPDGDASGVTASGGGEPVDPGAVRAEAAGKALQAPVYITREGIPFPPELQQRLDAAAGTEEGIDPSTLYGAQTLGDPGVRLSASEEFVSRSYQAGLIDTDTFLDQIGDKTFLNDPSTARAAQVLSGTGPDPSKAEDFVNDLYQSRHITQEKFIEHVNDAAFLEETDAAIASGSVTYTTENFGRAEDLLGMSEKQMADVLEPGYDVEQGPPSAEQVAALYELGGRSDRNFTELGSIYAQYHNPGLEMHFGHATAEDAENDVLGVFWKKDGEVVSDPFLDAIAQGIGFDDDARVVKDFHKARRPYAEGEIDGAAPGSVPIFPWQEGTSGHRNDETTDASRHVFGIAFPGADEMRDVLDVRPGTGFDVDDNFAGGDYPEGAIDGKARMALEGIDPELFGTQITQADGVDGLEITNSTRFDNTAVTAHDTEDLTVDLEDNAGLFKLEISDSADPTVNGGSGVDNIVTSDIPVVDGYAYREAMPTAVGAAAPIGGASGAVPQAGQIGGAAYAGLEGGTGTPLEALDFDYATFLTALGNTAPSQSERTYAQDNVTGTLYPGRDTGTV